MLGWFTVFGKVCRTHRMLRSDLRRGRFSRTWSGGPGRAFAGKRRSDLRDINLGAHVLTDTSLGVCKSLVQLRTYHRIKHMETYIIILLQ